MEILSTWISWTMAIATLVSVSILVMSKDYDKFENSIISFISTFGFSIFLLALYSAVKHLITS